MRGQRMLVTGASGFLGTHLVRKLVGLGAEVHLVSRKPWPVGDHPFRTWVCDLADPVAVDGLLQAVRPRVVLHLASYVAGVRDVTLVLPSFAANLQSAVNLMTSAVNHGRPRVVIAGSMEEPRAGENVVAPSSPYAASKWASTIYAQMFHALWGLPTVVLRIAMAYGPAQPDTSKLVPYVITSLLSGQSPELTSGDRQIDWVYVDDVIEAFVAAATAPNCAGKVYQIGSGSPVSIRATVRMIEDIVGSGARARFGALVDRRLESARIVSPAEAADELGWCTRVGLREGLERTVDWYRERCAASPEAPRSQGAPSGPNIDHHRRAAVG